MLQQKENAQGPTISRLICFHGLDTEGREYVLEVIIEWWNSKKIPQEATIARVAHLYKKGNTANLANYRPLSLLNSMVKLYAKNYTQD